MIHSVWKNRGSALLLALGVLALLAVMATTFVTMTRMESKLNARYTDDVQCEMLAKGLLEYVRGILADDLDRSMKILPSMNPTGPGPQVAAKYENRDTTAPYIDGYFQFQNRLAGLNTDDNVVNTDETLADTFSGLTRLGLRLGIPPSNDFWLGTHKNSGELTGTYYAVNTWATDYAGQVGSFYCWYDEPRRITAPLIWLADRGTTYNVDNNGVGYDIWVTLNQNGIDDDQNGVTDPGWGQGSDGSLWQYYDTCTAFLAPMDQCGYLQGPMFTGAYELPGGAYWRASLNVGMPQGTFYDINVTGNMEKLTPDCPARMNPTGTGPGMDGQGLRVVPAGRYHWQQDMSTGNPQIDATNYGSGLAGLSFQGYAGETAFPTVGYDTVYYSPLQTSLRDMLYDALLNGNAPASMASATQGLPDTWAESIIRARYGGNMLAAGGDPRYRPGWRADGASFFVIPSPDAAQSGDTYYGPEEMLDRITPARMAGTAGSPASSRLFNVARCNVFQAQPDPVTSAEWASMLIRGRLSVMGKDNILRGKIWFTEKHGQYANGQNDSNLGIYQVPAAMRTEGEWRNISILKRVNLNILGARDSTYAFRTDGTLGGGPNYRDFPTSEVAALKQRWILKQQYEQDRCFYMLKGALKWYGWTDVNAAKGACQLIATLADMIDRDQDETVYTAPDGSGAVGYGCERFPVINEIGLEINNNVMDANFRFRVELFNPTENIPWLPDKMEAIDLTRYKLRVRCPSSGKSVTCNIPSLDKKGTGAFTPGFNTTLGKCTSVGMGGVDGKDAKRYLHVSLDNEVRTSGITLDDLAAGIQVDLLKDAVVDVQGNRAERLVDRAAMWNVQADGSWTMTDLKLASYNNESGPYTKTARWVGVYRRMDPLNARTRYSAAVPDVPGRTNQLSVVHGTVPLAQSASFGKVNSAYGGFLDAGSYDFDPKYTRDLKIPDTDLPSIGWIGEALYFNYMNPPLSNGTALCVTEIGPTQDYLPDGNTPNPLPAGQLPNMYFSCNPIDKCKFDLFKPFGSSRNLHVLDIFTCWDPSNDGVDNDGDGVADNDAEVNVFGRLDLNSARAEVVMQLTGTRAPLATSGRGSQYGGWTIYPTYARGRANWIPASAPSPPDGGGEAGPYETIGDWLRWDRMSQYPGRGTSNWGGNGQSNYWTGYDSVTSDHRGWPLNVNDGDNDGKLHERNEGDAVFTWFCNFFTTRNMVFTAEVITEITDPPLYPGRATPHHAYVVSSTGIRAQKHLLAIMDRSSAFKVRSDGGCDFTGPVRILALRWAQVNK